MESTMNKVQTYDEKVTWVWVCNECDSRELADSVSGDDLEWLSCTGCGCNEFHLEYFIE